MPSYGSQSNDAFTSGVAHQVNTGRGNDSSVTLGGSLQAASDRFNALTPHGVLNAALGGSSQDDSSWERLSRAQGGYQPGSMTAMQDQLDQGTDNLP
jgi:hypothetical protein